MAIPHPTIQPDFSTISECLFLSIPGYPRKNNSAFAVSTCLVPFSSKKELSLRFRVRLGEHHENEISGTTKKQPQHQPMTTQQIRTGRSAATGWRYDEENFVGRMLDHHKRHEIDIDIGIKYNLVGALEHFFQFFRYRWIHSLVGGLEHLLFSMSYMG